jgi:hypothetical protein
MDATTLDPLSVAQMQQWIAENVAEQKVEEKLISMGYPEDVVAVRMIELKKQKLARRQASGFIWSGLGAFLGFVSCALTIINPIPEIYYWILYGLTSIAILIICRGLYLVFE